jgi:glycosyltransferase involved in cell wall biosynthesis
MSNRPGILFVINDFNVGGAELFVYRLGIALQQEFYPVFILELLPEKADNAFKQQFLDNGFVLINRHNTLSNFKEKLFWKINALCSLVGVKGIFSKLKKHEQHKLLIHSIKKQGIKIVHSHYFSSDTFVRTHLYSKDLKWVMTMHGDYNETVYANMAKGKPLFLATSKENIQSVDALTYVADVNLAILKEFQLTPKRLKKIRLGLSKQVIEMDKLLVKDAFTFCMVARANPDKGWEVMLKAFSLLNQKHPNTKLYCVGPTEGILKDLVVAYSNNEKIVFTGYTSSPSDYILKSDVGVLPTYFEGESSPYSVIEYLSCGKPVIATDKGEISDMLTTSGELAGILIQLKDDNKPSVIDLMEAMEKMVLDKTFYDQKVKLTPKAFEKFTIEKCKQEYMELYHKVLTDEFNVV